MGQIESVVYGHTLSGFCISQLALIFNHFLQLACNNAFRTSLAEFILRQAVLSLVYLKIYSNMT